MATIAATVSVTPNSLLPLHRHRSKRYAIVYKGGNAGQAGIGLCGQLFGTALTEVMRRPPPIVAYFMSSSDVIGTV
jgi:hypothetical protein